MRFNNVFLITLLAIGYSLASPTPRKCNRKHLLEARVDQPAYYVIDPSQQDYYPYGDPSMFTPSHHEPLVQPEIRILFIFPHRFGKKILFLLMYIRGTSSTDANDSNDDIFVRHWFASVIRFPAVVHVSFPSVRHEMRDQFG